MKGMVKMTSERIKEILEKHKKWLNGEEGGERANLYGDDLRGADLNDADLREANLCGANLRRADLRGANLRGADLCGADLSDADLREANLDYSCIPLWCGGLHVHIDDRLAIQELFHLISNVEFSKNISDELKNALCTEELIAIANRFHRVDECGEIKP